MSNEQEVIELTEHEKIKHRKTGIVIIIASILVLIMRLYILSAILFLIGIVVISAPFKKNTIELNGTSTNDDNCNCKNCSCGNSCGNGCNNSCSVNTSDIIDAINNTDYSENIEDGQDIKNEANISESKVDIEPTLETEIEPEVKQKIDDEPSVDLSIHEDIDIQSETQDDNDDK